MHWLFHPSTQSRSYSIFVPYSIAQCETVVFVIRLSSFKLDGFQNNDARRLLVPLRVAVLSQNDSYLDWTRFWGSEMSTKSILSEDRSVMQSRRTPRNVSMVRKQHLLHQNTSLFKTATGICKKEFFALALFQLCSNRKIVRELQRRPHHYAAA